MSGFQYHPIRGGTIGLAGAALVAGLGLLLAGCPSQSSESSSSPAPVAQAASFGGTVFGGRQPVECATVTAYAATTGGGAPTEIGSGLTGGNGTNCAVGAGAGNFSFPFSPTPASGEVIYVVANGGYAVPGSVTANGAIKLMTVAGAYCDIPGCGFPDNVNVNELSTVAAAYSMAGFIALPGGEAVNITGKSPGLPNAAKTFANLVNAANGQARVPDATGCTGSGEPVNCDALRRLDTLANVIAACVNADGATSGACSGLFADTMPTSGTEPADTLAALVNIVSVPEIRNKGSDIFGLAPVLGIYSPALTVSPNAWMLALNYTGGGLNSPAGIAIDADGNVWTTSFNNSSVNEFSVTGAPLSGSGYTGGGLNQAYGIAVDPVGNVWTASYIGNSVNKFTGGDSPPISPDTCASPGSGGTTGCPLSGASGYTGGGLNNPVGIAIDGAGHVWTASQGSTSVNEFSAAGAPASSSGYTGGGLNKPDGISVDKAGNVWVASYGNSRINKFDSNTSKFVGTGYNGGGLSAPIGLAIDDSGNVWTASYSADSINEFSPAGAPLSGTGYAGGGLDNSYAIAIDADGNVWTSSYGNSTVNEFSELGQVLSPSSGYIAGALNKPFFFSIAVDPSGNVWVSNYGNSSVTEFIGAAAPTRTPIVSAIANGFTP